MLSSEPSIPITPLHGALSKIKSEFKNLEKQEEQDKLEDDSDALVSRYFYFPFLVNDYTYFNIFLNFWQEFTQKI